MRDLHRAIPLVLALLCLSLPAVVTAGESDPEPPGYFVEHLVPTDETVPEGWKLDDDGRPPAGGPTEAQLTALGEGLGLDEDQFYVEYRLFNRKGVIVPAGMIDVEKKVGEFHAALKAQAEANGWRVRELGSPTRVLVVGGSQSGCADLTEALVEHTVYALSEIAMNRLRGRSGSEEAGRSAALEYVKAIKAISPKAGTAQAVTGVVHLLLSAPKKKGEKPDRAEQEMAVSYWAKSLKSGVPYPPKGSVYVFVAGRLGGILLDWKDKSKLEQATKALKLAVEREQEAKTQGLRYMNRYNLACAYARARKLSAAFEALEKSLEVLKIMPPQAFRAEHKKINEKDEDMAPLRSDPRFSALMKKFEPPAQKKPGQPPNHPEPKKDPE